jgi:hypothetical protein
MKKLFIALLIPISLSAASTKPVRKVYPHTNLVKKSQINTQIDNLDISGFLDKDDGEYDKVLIKGTQQYTDSVLDEVACVLCVLLKTTDGRIPLSF